jgi:hypothetical protein
MYAQLKFVTGRYYTARLKKIILLKLKLPNYKKKIKLR